MARWGVVPGEIAPGDPNSPVRKFTKPSDGGLLPGVGSWIGLAALVGIGSNPINVPPYPLDWELGESTDALLVRPPQFSLTE